MQPTSRHHEGPQIRRKLRKSRRRTSLTGPAHSGHWHGGRGIITNVASFGAFTARAEADPTVLAAGAMAGEAAAGAGTDAVETDWPPVPALGRLAARSAVSTEPAEALLAWAGDGVDDGPPVTEELRVAAAAEVLGRVDAVAPRRGARRAPTNRVSCGTVLAGATTTSPIGVVEAADVFGLESVRPRVAVPARDDGAGPDSVKDAALVPAASPVSATATAGTATVQAPIPNAMARAPTRPK